MHISFNRVSNIIQDIEKVYLTKEERAALQSMLNLPLDLRILVEDKYVLADQVQFNFDINEDGYWHLGRRYPIVWLNSPQSCRKHLHESLDNKLRLVFRKPKLETKIPYDFARVLISKAH